MKKIFFVFCLFYSFYSFSDDGLYELGIQYIQTSNLQSIYAKNVDRMVSGISQKYPSIERQKVRDYVEQRWVWENLVKKLALFIERNFKKEQLKSTDSFWERFFFNKRSVVLKQLTQQLNEDMKMDESILSADFSHDTESSFLYKIKGWFSNLKQ